MALVPLGAGPDCCPICEAELFSEIDMSIGKIDRTNTVTLSASVREQCLECDWSPRAARTE